MRNTGRHTTEARTSGRPSPLAPGIRSLAIAAGALGLALAAGVAAPNAAVASTTTTIVTSDDVFAVAAGHTVTISWADLVANDVNDAHHPIFMASHTLPAHGARTDFSALHPSEGYVSYTPDAGFTGTDSFQYDAYDALGNLSASPGTVIIHVFGQASPVAVDDALTTSAGKSLSVASPGILFNDTDADSDKLTMRVAPADLPAHGVLHLDADARGGFSYTPSAGFVGTDSFRYTARDAFGGSSAGATVTITVIESLKFTSMPVISGTTEYANWLMVKPPTVANTGATLSYQWYRGDVALPKETNTFHSISAADVGSSLSVRVTASKPGLQSIVAASAPTKTITNWITYHPKPYISGTPKVGSTLTANAQQWLPSGVALAYQWKRSGTAIVGATNPTYVLAGADAGKLMSVSVTGSKALYTSFTMTSDQTAAVAKGSLTAPLPKISGPLAVGQTLVVSPGVWGPGAVPLTYTYKRDGVAIATTGLDGYVLAPADLGTSITVTVSGSLPGYLAVARTSSATATITAGTLTSTSTPKVTGTAKVGSVLTAHAGPWAPSGVTLMYTWRRSGVAIAGATASTYTLRAADAGKAITLAVTASKAGYSTLTKTSAPTAAIAP